jgi:hypothetical protein
MGADLVQSDTVRIEKTCSAKSGWVETNRYGAAATSMSTALSDRSRTMPANKKPVHQAPAL